MDPLHRIVAFLDSIGLAPRRTDLPDGTFLPGVRIRAGGLEYDPARLTWPGDLLHEAGHIAAVPSVLRPRLSDDVAWVEDVAFATEVEATAWAFAAVCHLQLDPTVLFHEGGYHGASAQLAATYAIGVYPGAYGLAQAGMTRVGADLDPARAPVYPVMGKWLRD